MKPRKVVVTLEMNTAESVRGIIKRLQMFGTVDPVELVQIQVNVVKPEKKK